MANSIEQINAILAGERAAYDAQKAQGRANYEAAQQKLQQQNAVAQQEAYLGKMEDLRTMPQYLAARGSNGGTTDSTYSEILNNYRNSRNKNDQTLNEGIANLSLDYNNSLEDVNAKIAQAEAQAQADRINAAARLYSGKKSDDVDYSEFASTGDNAYKNAINTYANIYKSNLSNEQKAAAANQLKVPTYASGVYSAIKNSQETGNPIYGMGGYKWNF